MAKPKEKVDTERSHRALAAQASPGHAPALVFYDFLVPSLEDLESSWGCLCKLLKWRCRSNWWASSCEVPFLTARALGKELARSRCIFQVVASLFPKNSQGCPRKSWCHSLMPRVILWNGVTGFRYDFCRTTRYSCPLCVSHGSVQRSTCPRDPAFALGPLDRTCSKTV